jgi:hypothetical protein
LPLLDRPANVCVEVEGVQRNFYDPRLDCTAPSYVVYDFVFFPLSVAAVVGTLSFCRYAMGRLVAARQRVRASARRLRTMQENKIGTATGAAQASLRALPTFVKAANGNKHLWELWVGSKVLSESVRAVLVRSMREA